MRQIEDKYIVTWEFVYLCGFGQLLLEMELL